MNEKYQKYLYLFTTLGMKPQEAEVYFGLLILKQATVRSLTRTTNIQRTYIYDILKILDGKGIVSCVEIRGIKYYTAISVDQFKKRQENRLQRLTEAIPEIKSLIGHSKNAPRVQFYEGKEGFIEAQNDTLLLPRGGEILAYYTGEGLYESDPELAENYIRRRVARRISVRAIGTAMPASERWWKRDREQLRQSRMVSPDKFPFANEINIYGNKISILSLVDELIAVVIESETIARTQRAIFELAWRGAGQVKGGREKVKGESGEQIQRVTQKVLFEREGKILMMKDTNGNWELPGGTIDFGEEAQTALERELTEEMNINRDQYQIGEMIGKFNIMRHFPDKHYHFLALIYKGELKVDDFQISHEHTEYGWFGMQEIMNLQMVEGYKEFFEKVNGKI